MAEKPDGDGMVTATPGIILAVASADCVPILMTDAREKVVGAIHAGWRGVIAGIAREGAVAMESLGAKPRDLRAALGPSIGKCCFEVDEELARSFRARDSGRRAPFACGAVPERPTSICARIITDQLMAAGLPRESIANIGPCTRCANDQFFSRRASSASGLQLSFIGLRG